MAVAYDNLSAPRSTVLAACGHRLRPSLPVPRLVRLLPGSSSLLAVLAAVLASLPAAVGAAELSASGLADTSAMAPQSSLARRESPGLRLHPDLDPDQLPVFTRSQSLQGDPASRVILQGNAEVRRNDVILKGSRIDYDRVADVLDAEGDVRLLRDGSVVTGPALRLNLEAESGEFQDPEFYVAATGGSGQAERAEFISRTQTRLHEVVYSGCPCPEPDWYIKARQVDLDFAENEGVARNGIVYFKGVPILGSPYLSFPLSDARKSGFLPPTFGVTSRSGVQVTVPYYLNLAPNYDATVYPTVYGRRGLQLGAEFRYLGLGYQGQLYGSWMAHDRESNGDQRWYYSIQHQQDLGRGFGLGWDLQRASDDDYFRDFSAVALDRASTVTLPQSVTLGWANSYFSAQLTPVQYQVLQDLDSPITPPYDMLPRFAFSGNRYDWHGADLRLAGEAIHFRRAPWLASGTRLPREEGSRVVAYPSITAPILRPGWFVVPKAGIHASSYRTDFNRSLYYDRQSPLGGLTEYDIGSANRVLPILSLDSGLIFERDAQLFGRAMTQTLEPRLYYLYVPYRDQSTIPVYDTALADFGFSQLFSENLFSGGWDRIANANQLTAALTTRWLDGASGAERLRLSAAQRLYFTDQRVTLPGEAPRSNERSDFLFEIAGSLTNDLSGQATIQYNPYINRLEQSSISARWDAARLASVYAGYRYIRRSFQQSGQEQVSLAMQWPFSARWYGVGRIDYSMQDSRFTQVLGGVEYNGGCCWTARVVAQRYAVSTESSNTALFFQLELNGLGRLGTDPLETLRRNIPGYQPVSRPIQPGTPFERYE